MRADIPGTMSFQAMLNWTQPVAAPALPLSAAEGDRLGLNMKRDERFALPSRPSGLALPAFVPAPPPVAPGFADAF